MFEKSKLNMTALLLFPEDPVIMNFLPVPEGSVKMSLARHNNPK